MSWGHRRRGFTLIEVVVVVGIIAILGGLAAYNIDRSKEKITLERRARELRGMFEKARALSATAGTRLGTNRLVHDASCPNTGGNGEFQMYIRIDRGAQQVEIPVRIDYDAGTDQLTVSCETWDLATELGNVEGEFEHPLADVTFGFSPGGRVVFPPAGPLLQSIYVRLRHPTRNAGHGFRVLRSGVVCHANGGPLPISCDESV